MKIVVRCRDDRMYNFVFAECQYDVRQQSWIVQDRDGSQHYFPSVNVVHLQCSKDDTPVKR